MKLIRWKAAAPTAIAAVLLVVFTIFFLDGIIKKVIINACESVFLAKVEISSLNTRFKNMSVEVSGLKIADKEDVWKNLVEAVAIKFSVEPLPLLSKKLIIDEMTVADVKWGTKRPVSGALPPRKKKKIEKRGMFSDEITEKIKASLEKKASAEISNLAVVSDIKSIEKNIKDMDLKKVSDLAGLTTLKEVEKMRTDIIEKEAKYNKIMSEMNVESKIREISAAAAAVKDISLKTPEDIQNLKENVKKLKNAKEASEKMYDQVSSVKNEIAGDFVEGKDLVKRIDELKDADYRNIMSKFNMDNFSTGNIAKTLIGPVWITRVNNTVHYIGLARKFMPKSTKKQILKKRMKGTDVVFEKENELPGLLVKKIEISGTTGGEGKDNSNAFEFSGKVRDITSNPAMLGKPTTATIYGEKSGRRFDLDVMLDHTRDVAVDELTAKLTGMTPKDIGIDNLGNLLFVASGDVTVKARFSLSGEMLKAVIDTSVEKIIMGVPEEENDAQKIFAKIFGGLKEMYVNLSLSGPADNLGFTVKSNLDEIFKNGVKTVIGEKLAEIKAKVRAEIDKQVDAKKQEFLSEATKKRDALLGNVAGKQKLVSDKAEEIKSRVAEYENKIKQKEEEFKNKADEKKEIIQKQGEKQIKKQLKGILNGK